MKKNYKKIFIITISIFMIFGFIYAIDLGIDVGSKAVDFSLEEISSVVPFKLSNYYGKNPVLVNFFATWCPYCVKEIPELNKINNIYGKKGLVVVAINVQEKKEKVANFIDRKKILYKILLDVNAEVAQKKYKVFGIPTNILINSKGVIVFRGNDLPTEDEIKKNLINKKTNK
jgi:thiol-disulfide isomerase/thioredoxin